MKHLTVLTGQGAADAFAQPRQDERLRVGVRLPSPDTLRRDVPASFAALATVDAGRSQSRAILERRAVRRLLGDRSVHRLGGDRGRAAACVQPAARAGAPTWPAYAAFPHFFIINATMSTTSADTLNTPAGAGASFLPLLLANFSMVAGTYAFVTVAGPMARRMHLAPLHIGAIIGIVGLVWMLAAPRWARVADLRGRLPAMRAAIGGFVASSLLLTGYVGWALRNGGTAVPAVWTGFVALLVTRAAMGGCYAGLSVAATAWIADRTAVEGRAGAIARFGAAGAVGMVVAPPLAGWIAGYDMTLALAVFALLPLAGLAGLRGQREGREYAVRQAPPRLKPTEPRLRLPWFSALALYSAVMIANSALGFYVIDRLGVSAQAASLTTGYALGSAGLGLIAMQALVGRLRVVAPVQWLRWGALVAGAGFASVLVAGATQPLLLCASYLVAACGMGAAFPAAAALASARVAAHEQAACAGAMSMAQGLSMVIGPLAGAMLYELHPALPFVSIGVILAGVSAAASWRGSRAAHA